MAYTLAVGDGEVGGCLGEGLGWAGGQQHRLDGGRRHSQMTSVKKVS